VFFCYFGPDPEESPPGLEPGKGEPMQTPSGTAPAQYAISAFYYFKKLDQLETIKTALEQKARELNIRGLLILGQEGINTTCSSSNHENLEVFKKWIVEFLGLGPVQFKMSYSDQSPFRRYKVKIRDEIVTTGIPEMMPPETGLNHHLTPAQWNQVMKEDPDHIIIDTRNWYEYQVGTFKGALNPNIEKFTDFPEYIEKQGIPKNKKMLIFCTGGIRCEKGILELQKHGYDQVYQLEGGILKYLEESPNDQFEGECFVFDHRVAVDQNLKPSKRYALCPHCGQPGDTQITCERCDHVEKICVDCAKAEFKKNTCSKNCAHQWEVNPGKKGQRQIHPFELEHLVATQGEQAPLKEIRVTKTKVTRINEFGEAETVTQRND
jgi:UPF0176 protein